MHYIGLDVHSKATNFCILDENGRVMKEFQVKAGLSGVVARLKELKKELGAFKVVYEASCGYGWLHDQLVPVAARVLVAHPGKVRLIFRSKRKTDRIDAKKLAKLLYLDEVPLAHVPPAERRQWRSLIEYRRKLIVQRSATKNRLRALLRTNAIQAPRGLWSLKGLTWLAQQELSPAEKLQRDHLLLSLREVGEKIKDSERILKQIAAENPGVSLLMTIPGVGIRTAEAVLAYVDDAHRFRRNKSVGCYFGLVPCEDTSQKRRLGHITKEGPACVRQLVTEAAWQAIRKDAQVKAYFERVMRKDANRRKIALVATAHHLLRVMHAMLRSGEVWRSSAA